MAESLSKRLGGEKIKVIKAGRTYEELEAERLALNPIAKQVSNYIKKGIYVDGPIPKEVLVYECKKNKMDEYKSLRALEVLWKSGQIK